ncbi:type II toxin-antitoxin system RelE/ParE family toxin [Candidatus Pacearchaeota archaeon]|nr:type II toxin-antitoxin system RelE/ParE family toxin [Candidatus Pacearchaeota archaeon]
MNFEIKFSSRFAKFLRSLPNNILSRIKNKFEIVSTDPFRYLKHFEGDGYKLRIGDFRAIIDVDKDRNILFVRIFDRRGRIYK